QGVDEVKPELLIAQQLAEVRQPDPVLPPGLEKVPVRECDEERDENGSGGEEQKPHEIRQQEQQSHAELSRGASRSNHGRPSSCALTARSYRALRSGSQEIAFWISALIRSVAARIASAGDLAFSRISSYCC